jgi:hypothetical protein
MFKTKQSRYERERQKQLFHLTQIAEAYMKARGVYPPEYDGFLEVAGQKEVDVFYQTMHLVEKGAEKWQYRFDWYYDQNTNEWAFVFTDKSEENGNE